MKPLILLNFKTYPETLGKRGISMAKSLARTQKKKYRIAIAPTLLTLREVAKTVSMPIFAQHVDPIENGSHTGSITITELAQAGVTGVIINHSEKKISTPDLKKTLELCKKYKLLTVVCASSMFEVKRIAALHSDYLAYEPKELIGGEVSVTKAKPNVILRAVDAVKLLSPVTKVLCGAGVHSKEDIGQSLLLGAHGVLIGHAVPKARDPKKFLEGMLL